MRSSPITSSFTQSVLERLARHARGQHGVVRRVAAGGVRQQEAAGALQHLDQRPGRGRVHAAQRDRDDLGARRGDRALHHVEAAKATGAEDQARAPAAAGDLEAAT